MKSLKTTRVYVRFLTLLLLIGIFYGGATTYKANAATADDFISTGGEKSRASRRDDVPPGNPSELTIRAYNTAFSPAVMDVWWNAAEDNLSVTGYVLERSLYSDFTNPKIYKLKSAKSLTDKTVAPATTYYWRIKAMDGAGNLSPEWTVLSASTPSRSIVNKQFIIEGDSASVGYGLDGYAEGPPEVLSSQRWGEMLAQKLDGTWVVKTVAQGGGRILGDIGLLRSAQITPLRQPSFERNIVFLWAGTNDIYGLPSRGIAPTAPEAVYDAMKKYVETVKAEGFEVWIMDAYPRNAFGFTDKDFERIKFNNMLRRDNSFADKFLDIDAWSEFQSRLNKIYYQADEAHMTMRGNAVVAERVYAELVASPMTIITPSTLPAGKISAVYSQPIESSGGKGTRAVSLVTGELPSGLNLVNETIKGTPAKQGTFEFTLQVKDSIGTSVNRKYNLTIQKANGDKQ